ncbi:MAG: 3-deoxy-D-manno-octulosonic acid kinase [Hydrogenophaga sp.]|uniref:3-deoxy-D-manno-octulosonic acid kinase n=1 Tax=Hydrogenophaga sp. TaxID=1904254 RepID=UPI0027171D8A|nr:3-deoxy-D-manno-octulosonic acid kinase [Hydrogenophaga sp.]MDO9149190.1 3-deoxy-D-manno-octulosonic acid kinase [Hydrogenophaga sp.]MDO9606160.1 3-deoxy-D-manno-octulosonic acid kinase [Hydrogenophaga sp.]MDP2163894.1 3-deoxy-D-manno-octulosonic acid kinase [Hydrogenophaga sp.]MDP3476080.1 3-deoxy-D-manno-octulosonic acid kinase [Hydrogenophaga sp.]
MAIAHRAYRLLARLLCLPLLAWLWWRGRKEPAYRLRLKERLGFIDVVPASLGGVWVHAASVGEAQAVRPLVNALLRQLPAHQLTISCQTPTGAATLQAHWGNRLRVVYAPLDTPGACVRFLARLQPRLLVLVERELWPEMLAQCRAQAIPVALVNARLSARSARGYQRWVSLMQPVWQQLACVAAADDESAQRFQALGVPADRTVVTGNLKFDDPSLATSSVPPGNWPDLQGRTVVVAGSTHAPEEAELLAAWPDFQRRHPAALLVLVPRHPQRFEAVADLLTQQGLSFVRRSTAQQPQAHTQVLLGDTMGELLTWYRCAQVCFIGGSLAPIGGHNALEALGLGKPVLFGPHTEHFATLYVDVLRLGAGRQVSDARALFDAAHEWLQQPERMQQMAHAATGFFAANQGACQRTVQALRPWIAPGALAQAAGVQSMTLEDHDIWFDPDCFASMNVASFAPEHWGAQVQALQTGSGRGQVHKITHAGGVYVLRHYHRGGLMARLSRDAFWRVSPHQSRAMREFSLLRQMRAWQLPVPRAAAAHQHRNGWVYRADIVVEWIEDTRNVAQLLTQRALQATEYETLGRTIRQLHEREVFHSDLNCHNLLLNGAGKAWIVDFDKCGFRPAGPWQQSNLDRLLRSLRKEARKNPVFHWNEGDWAHLMTGYNAPLAPAPEATAEPMVSGWA